MSGTWLRQCLEQAVERSALKDKTKHYDIAAISGSMPVWTHSELP